VFVIESVMAEPASQMTATLATRRARKIDSFRIAP
jgi:hypothetical protein